MRWEIDTTFNIDANKDVLGFLGERSPSAHSDLVSELMLAAQNAPDSRLYCPDKLNYAFFAVHRPDHTIVALALGMRQIVFRLPELLATRAIQEGGIPFSDIGPGWVAFSLSSNDEPIAKTRRRLSHWCRQALLANSGGKAP